MCDNKKGLKVLKVNDELENDKYKPLHPFLPKPPFLLLGIGSVRSSKTTTLINMLRNEDMYGKKYWDDVLIISNTINNDTKGKYLKDAFRVEDHYKDSMITDLVNSQKSYDREEMPTTLLVLDDIINRDFKKTNDVSFLASRFRHYELSIMIFTQSFRAVSPIIRSNATDILIFRQQSSKEMEKVIEEYHDLAHSEEQFLKYYNIAHSSPYSFLYIDAQENPARFYKSFEELIGIGKQLVYKGTIPDENDDEVFSMKKNKKKHL